MNYNLKDCLLCSLDNLKLCAELSKGLRVWRCKNCQFTWVDREDLLNTGEKPNYDNYNYNVRIRIEFEKMKLLYLNGFQQRVNRFFTNYDLKRLTFLDIGCANGEYLWAAKKLGFSRVCGVEIDPVAVQYATAYGEVVDKIEKLHNNLFDIIQIKNVLSNIFDFVSFLKSALSLLKKNGVLFLDVLNQDSLTALLRNKIYSNHRITNRFGPIRPPYVINGFNKTSLLFLLNKFNLRVKYFSTSYMGSLLVPYRPALLPKLTGLIGTIFGMGSMLISESTFKH